MIKKNDITRSKADDFLRNGGRSSFLLQITICYQEKYGCIIKRLITLKT